MTSPSPRSPSSTSPSPVAERLPTPSRGAWIRTVARWMKAWAESVLAEEAAPASPVVESRPKSEDSAATGSPEGGRAAALPSGAAPAPPAEATLESLEARWLRDIQARSRVPIDDWVARMSKGVPHLPEGAPHLPEGDGLPRAHRVAPTSSSPAEAVGTPRSPLPAVPRSQAREARSMARPMAPSPGRVPAPARGGASGAPPVAPRSPLAPVPPPAPPPGRGGDAALESAPVPRVKPGSGGIGPEPAGAFRAPPAWPSHLTPRQPAAPPPPHGEVSAETDLPWPRSPWSGLPSFTDTPSTRPPAPVLRVVPPQPRETPGASGSERAPPSFGLPRFRLLFLDGEPVSAQEPRRGRISLSEEAGGWDSPPAPRAWRSREEAKPRSTEGTPTTGDTCLWPELPPAPTADSVEAVVELRQWERRRRLDREQRGE